MKKLVSWYKKKDKELETHFTAGLLQINFVTNALILLAFYIYLVISQSLYALSDRFVQFSFFAVLSFTMEVLPYGISSKKLKKKLSKIRICLKIGCQRKEKGQEKMTHLL